MNGKFRRVKYHGKMPWNHREMAGSSSTAHSNRSKLQLKNVWPALSGIDMNANRIVEEIGSYLKQVFQV